MRRPFLRDDAEITDEERRYFSETPLCASLDDCASHPHVEDPATIELVALVGFDHSRLYLVSARDGETKIAHRRMDGTTVAYGVGILRLELLLLFRSSTSLTPSRRGWIIAGTPFQ
mmetsp:Transcript_68335/g.191497  ORF Transcript_68335/g.191497 Transcript_68335/m.191497 type:complete len:116 (-) Transcript_68335:479-826(-)